LQCYVEFYQSNFYRWAGVLPIKLSPFSGNYHSQYYYFQIILFDYHGISFSLVPTAAETMDTDTMQRVLRGDAKEGMSFINI
jgi:hypothetical protein